MGINFIEAPRYRYALLPRYISMRSTVLSVWNWRTERQCYEHRRQRIEYHIRLVSTAFSIYIYGLWATTTI